MDKETIKQLLADGVITQEQAAKYFPELAKSEDERVRKGLLYVIEHHPTLPTEEAEEYIAWLEKQGEQKSAEWNEEDEKTIALNPDAYRIGFADGAARTKKELKPAEWSEDDKYYHCIIMYLLNNECVGVKDKENAISWFKSLKERVTPQPKQEWSIEDERIYQSIIDDTVQENQLNSKQTNWLRDIKYRYFPHPTQEWSEEDEINLKKAIWYVENPALMVVKDSMLVEWLKSLRPQNTWKPSDEQIKVLSEVANYAAASQQPHWNDFIYNTLRNLREQIKKL